MLLKTMFRKKSSEGFVFRSPLYKIAPAALIPLFLFILSCSNPTSPSSSTNPTNPTNPSGTDYKVTFNHNYGSSPQSIVINVQEGAKATAPSGITRTGYVIASWNTKADGSGTDWNFATATVSKALTLYAQWTEGQTHTSGNPEPAAPTKARMAFLGWYTSTAFTDFSKRVDFANQPSGTFNMYPKYVSATGYTIAADGTLSSVPSTVSAAATVEIPYNVNEIAVKKLQHSTGSTLDTGILGSSPGAKNTKVTTVYLPSRNLKTIGNNAFSYTTLLTSITIPGNVTTIGNSAFSYSNLKNLTLSVGLEKIENAAFQRTDIESVTIPSTVTSIGTWAFGGSRGAPGFPDVRSKVKSVRVEAQTPPVAGTAIFNLHPSTLSIKVPPGTKGAYTALAGWGTYRNQISEYTE